MKKYRRHFFEGSTKTTRLAFIGFTVAAFGVAIGFACQTVRPLAYMAFGITAVGVIIGFVAIAWGFFGGNRFD